MMLNSLQNFFSPPAGVSLSVSVSPGSVKSWLLRSGGEQVAVTLSIVLGQETSLFIWWWRGHSNFSCHPPQRVKRKIWTQLFRDIPTVNKCSSDTKSRPLNPLPSLQCGLWARPWTCADRGRLCRANDVSRVRGYLKETGQLHMSPGCPVLPSQADPVSLKWIIGPSRTALLQFSFSKLFYIWLLLCAWALADGCKAASQSAVSLYLRTHWMNPAVYWQVLNSSQVSWK